MFIVYSLTSCGFCQKAIEVLEQREEEFRVHILDNNQKLLNEMKDSYYWKTVPMIFQDHEFIGGYTDLLTVLGAKNDTV